MKNKIFWRSAAIWLVFFLLLFAMCACKWVNKQFGRVNYDEVMLVLDMGMRGVDSGLFWSFMRKVVFRAFGWSVAILILCRILKSKVRHIASISCGILGIMLVWRICASKIQTGTLFSGWRPTDFYEKKYVFPETADISFPQKRNVLLIVLESMEKSYADEKLFGNGGLTPHITGLERRNASFSGYNAIPGLGSTIAAIAGMTTGLPLFYTGYRNTEKMKNARGLGNVFLKHGYRTYSYFPASGKFSLKENFMRDKGFSEVVDGEAWKATLGYEPEVSPFDGVDDETLFRITKPRIQEIVGNENPYFILMETVNTHCEGFFLKSCEKMGFRQKNMEDIAKCEDKIVADFVEWFIKTDPSAVVILIDDHNQHTGGIMKKLSPLKSRPLSNVFINTKIFDGADMGRPVSAVDFFPTIIEAAGGIIKGCRLGLGASLSARCAGIKTLREKYDGAELRRLLESNNNLYYKLATGKDRK
ncbi:MAG: sulfatase-like hydrolase/transferase [Rickettsiales bacterium]|jgi:phosphoglycerol transferase|nr:sulfatase-like hydrolase/transferase [Rickettsiales bacterium]